MSYERIKTCFAVLDLIITMFFLYDGILDQKQ